MLIGSVMTLLIPTSARLSPNALFFCLFLTGFSHVKFLLPLELQYFTLKLKAQTNLRVHFGQVPVHFGLIGRRLPNAVGW